MGWVAIFLTAFYDGFLKFKECLFHTGARLQRRGVLSGTLDNEVRPFGLHLVVVACDRLRCLKEDLCQLKVPDLDLVAPALKPVVVVPRKEILDRVVRPPDGF